MLSRFSIYFYLFINFYSIQPLQAQDNNKLFLDKRDDTEYPLVEINGQTWFAIDLKYISPNAYFQEMDSLQTMGNFYNREESLTACPEGWTLTSKDHWIVFTMNLFNQITTNPNQGIDLLDHFSFDNPHKFAAGMLSPLSFWGTALNLKPTGRVQGDIFYSPEKNNYADYWTIGPDEKHPYYHIHIDPNLIVGHSHKHHLSPSAKKKRMFKVRCVKVE